MSKFLGYWWNGRDLEIWKLGNKNVVLNGWNGEIYYDCFEVSEDLLDVVSDEKIEVRPIYKDIDLLNDDFEIVDYEII